MTKISSGELKSIMAQCTGTEGYHKLSIAPLKCTDGMKAVAEAAGAYWLVDAIGSYQHEPKIKELEIQFWTLEVQNNNTAVLSCRYDKGYPNIVEQLIEYTGTEEQKR